MAADIASERRPSHVSQVLFEVWKNGSTYKYCTTSTTLARKYVWPKTYFR